MIFFQFTHFYFNNYVVFLIFFLKIHMQNEPIDNLKAYLLELNEILSKKPTKLL
jgi:hypothetical protein